MQTDKFQHCNVYVGHGQQKRVQRMRRRVLLRCRLQVHVHVLECGVHCRHWKHVGQCVAEVGKGVGQNARSIASCRSPTCNCLMSHSRSKRMASAFTV